LGQIAEAGFQGVEIFCSRGHFDYTSKAEFQAISNALAGHQLFLSSLHAPTSRDLSATREGIGIAVLILYSTGRKCR
jgi:sugar phosphate isomerase/epimerase